MPKLPTIQSVYVCAARQDIGPARSTHIYPDLFLYNQIYDVCLNISKTQASIPAPATVMGPYPARFARSGRGHRDLRRHFLCRYCTGDLSLQTWWRR